MWRLYKASGMKHFNGGSCNPSVEILIILFKTLESYRPSSTKNQGGNYHLFNIYTPSPRLLPRAVSEWELKKLAAQSHTLWRKYQGWFNVLWWSCMYDVLCSRCWCLLVASGQKMAGCGSAWTGWSWAQRVVHGSRKRGESTVKHGGLWYSKLRTLSTKYFNKHVDVFSKLNNGIFKILPLCLSHPSLLCSLPGGWFVCSDVLEVGLSIYMLLFWLNSAHGGALQGQRQSSQGE